MAFERVAILGTGLLGTSVGLALKAAKPQAQVVGFDRSRDAARGAQKVKGVDRSESLETAVRQADLVVMATPVSAMESLFEEIAPLLKPGAVVTDVGSTKGEVLRWADTALPESVAFVGGHPMAGKTITGPEAAEATLFQGAVWCIVPSARARKDAVDQFVKLVETLGAVPYFLDAGEHDGLVAAVSHLPYLMSVAFISHLGRERSWRETATLAAGGFAYATHLTDSDPQMFTDIVRTNRASIVERLDRYLEALEDLRNAIARDDLQVKTRFEDAQQLHQDWLSGRAQGLTGEGSADIPSTRSMLAGGLFGRRGQSSDKGNGR